MASRSHSLKSMSAMDVRCAAYIVAPTKHERRRQFNRLRSSEAAWANSMSSLSPLNCGGVPKRFVCCIRGSGDCGWRAEYPVGTACGTVQLRAPETLQSLKMIELAATVADPQANYCSRSSLMVCEVLSEGSDRSAVLYPGADILSVNSLPRGSLHVSPLSTSFPSGHLATAP